VEERYSYCRICEAICGVVADVDDGRVVRIRGDREHPVSKGYLCPKGAAMAKVLDDPDRVVQPLRRSGAPGEFEPVEWDEALDDIAARLGAIRRDHGPHAIAMYLGNPSAFSLSHITWAKGFLDAVGSRNFFSAAAQDTFGRQAASWFLYGTTIAFPIPDLPRTAFVLILGANPLVSHGSILTLPRIGDHLRDIVARGGSVVVVDPVCTKTANAFEHVSIRPGTDVWLLAGILQVLVTEELIDRGAARRVATGVDALAASVGRFDPATVEAATGVPAATIRDLAHRFAAASSAVAYARVGLGRGPHATTANALVDALAIMTGNFDRAGGALFGGGPVNFADLAARLGTADMGTVRTRVGDLPDLAGHLPWVLAEEIETPGDGQVRALVITAGNPVLSAPGGERLATLLEGLDLVVSLDLYVNESNRHADYILPAPASLERADLPFTFLAHMPLPFIQSTEAIVPAPSGVREEWTVFDELSRRMGLGGPFGQRSARFVARAARRIGRPITPSLVAGALLRLGRTGWTTRKIAAHPHGAVTADALEPGRAKKVVRHPGGRARLDSPEILAELRELTVVDSEAGTLRLVGRRSLRSINSWLHNVAGSGDEPALWVNPVDALAAGVGDGRRAKVQSAAGEIDVLVRVTEDVGPGTVCYPHGYGHDGGWTTANAVGGSNVNLLAPDDLASMDPLSGASFLDGIPVELVAVR
jgi:anaerobic selenocysteine-containing dehydrogenase